MEEYKKVTYRIFMYALHNNKVVCVKDKYLYINDIDLKSLRNA